MLNLSLFLNESLFVFKFPKFLVYYNVTMITGTALLMNILSRDHVITQTNYYLQLKVI